MAKALPDKVLVTNQGVLKSKYGAAYSAVLVPALSALTTADKARGVTTLVVALDDAKAMKKYKGKPVTKATDVRQNKAAIDAVYKALDPAYLCILGATDVVPHQSLSNPISSDGDATVPSDLPYACARAYSRRIEDFLQPTRVVGRLPDLTGGGNASYLAGLLGGRTTWFAVPSWRL